MAYNKLVIDGVQVPHATKEGYSCTYNKVWSKNTGRSANATMLGDIVAVKRTVRQKVDRMTADEVNALSAVVDSTTPFHSATFWNPKTKSYVSATFYSADMTYTVEKYVNGIPKYKDIQIELVEQ